MPGHRRRAEAQALAEQRASAAAARRPRRARPSSPARAARPRRDASRGRRRACSAWDDHIARACSSSSTSATPRPTSGPIDGAELVEHWRFATVRDSTADELGAALRNLLELRGIGLADLDALDRVEHGAAAGARVGGDGSALPRPRDAGRRPRHQDRHGAALRQPARDRRRPARQRRGRLRPRQGRLHRRRLRHRAHLSTRSARTASTWAGSSRRASRSRWRR